MNARWRHFGEIRASDLMLLDGEDKDVMARPDAPDPSAWKTLVLAYSTGKPLNVMTDDLAQKTADGWLPYNDQAFAHFDYLKRQLDKTDPSYCD